MDPPTASVPMHTNTFGKIRLLLWKNYLLQLRHPIQTAVDVLLPVLIFLLCAYMNKGFGLTTTPEANHPSLTIDNLDPLL